MASMAQHSMAQHSMGQHSMAQHSMAQHSMARPLPLEGPLSVLGPCIGHLAWPDVPWGDSGPLPELHFGKVRTASAAFHLQS